MQVIYWNNWLSGPHYPVGPPRTFETHYTLFGKSDNPTTQTELLFFLGQSNVVRKFEPNAVCLAAQLNKVLKKNQPKSLGPLNEKESAADLSLSEDVISPLVLTLGIDKGPYTLKVNVSYKQLGCELLHEVEDGRNRPVRYWPRSLNDKEGQLTTTLREFLAVIWAVAVLRPYL